MTPTTASSPTWPSRINNWAKDDRLSAVLLAAITATLAYAFGIMPLFRNGEMSTFRWAWQAWNPETNYEHAKLIPLIVAFLVWHARDQLRAAHLGSSRWGWLFIGIGLALLLLGARTVQGRVTLTALPFLLYGLVLYGWGRDIARVLFFPIAFLLFMVPLNFLAQATVPLQFLETGAASFVCNLIGIGVQAVGTTINATNGAFRFQVDEGCSGIRSLMAIAMLAAIYGHLTQNRWWKKLALFAGALIFAIIGNAGRLVSIMVVARLFGQDIAGGTYHSLSGYLSFPFAIGAMLLFGTLLNGRQSRLRLAELAR